MKLSQYGYDFTADMLAKYPAENRDEARLMVINRATGAIEHRIFKDIIDYFDEKDIFVFNDTKVFPARLYGNKEKTGAEIEIFLLRELNRDLRLWDVLVDPARKIRIGNKLYFGDDDMMGAEVIDNTPRGGARCDSSSTARTTNSRRHSTASARHPSPAGCARRWSPRMPNATRRSSPSTRAPSPPPRQACTSRNTCSSAWR